jgi:hypothetical protein
VSSQNACDRETIFQLLHITTRGWGKFFRRDDCAPAALLHRELFATSLVEGRDRMGLECLRPGCFAADGNIAFR